MNEIDYITERRKLMEEFHHHHFRPTYVGLDGRKTGKLRWRVGGDRTEGCPDEWAGLPIVYVEARDVPRLGTQDWLHGENPLVRPRKPPSE